MVPALLLLFAVMDWPGWRGPVRDGVSSTGGPVSWNSAPRKVWEAKSGSGYSSPVLSDGRVYTMWRNGNDEVVAAFDFSSGREVWRARYASPFQKSSYAPNMEPGPFSTPVAAAGKLCTLGGSGVLSCFDAATGKLLWRKDHVKVSTANLFTGSAMSPLIDGGNVIAFLGDDTRAALSAFDLATGAERWTWHAEDAPGYASPIIARIGTTRQLVALTDRRAISLDPGSGRLLWSVPFPDQWKENIVTPVQHGERIIVSGVRRGTFAVEVNGSSPRIVWDVPAMPMYMSSPVLDGDTLYGFSSRNKGHFFAMDARSGKILWSGPARAGETAGLLSLGRDLAALMPDGELQILERTPAAFKPKAKFHVADSATWTQPVPTGSGLIIQSVGSLARWDWAAQ